MTGLSEAIPDIVLSLLYIFLLIRVATSSDLYFKTPFYTFFITTGVYSVICVVGFHVLSQFLYTENHWTVYIYKISHVLNVVGSSGATFGKAVLAIHRCSVLRARDFSETWPKSVIIRTLLAQFLFAAVATAPIYPASYVYHNGYILALSKDHMFIMKVWSVSMYFIYIICNGITTVLTSRALIRLGKVGEAGDTYNRMTVLYQRNMFIVVTVCSISHFIKAILQIVTAFATYLAIAELYQLMIALYPIVNGLATYSAPVCLVVCSAKVRARVIPQWRNYELNSTVAVSTIQIKSLS